MRGALGSALPGRKTAHVTLTTFAHRYDSTNAWGRLTSSGNVVSTRKSSWRSLAPCALCAILADADARIDGCAPFVAVEDAAQCYGMSEPPDEARRTNDVRTLGVERGPGRLRSRR